MQINITNMKLKLITLTNKLNDYQDDLLNLYNELNNASSYWQDPHAIKFFNNVKKEQLQANNLTNELTSLQEIYTYLVDKYETIGNKIQFELDQKNACFAKIDNFLTKITQIINAYNHLDTSFCPEEAKYIQNEQRKLLKVAENLKTIRKDLKIIFNEIEETEKNIQAKLSKINLEIVKETDIKEFIGG